MSRINHDSVPTPSTPVAPPPPYTEFAAGPSSSSSMGVFPAGHPNTSHTSTPSPHHFHHQQQSAAMVMPSGPQLPPHHPGYGPTPLASNQPLLPYAYYEARGSADARARSRFLAAFFCAVGLWLLVALAVSVEVLDEEGWLRRSCLRDFWTLDRTVRYWLWLRMSNGASELVAA